MHTGRVAAAPAKAQANANAAKRAHAPWFRLLPADGILTILLAALVVFTTALSIEAVTPAWVTPGMSVLTYTTFAGLFIGYLVVQQGRLPRSLVDLVAVGLGVAFAVQQTAVARTQGQWRTVLAELGLWFKEAILHGGGSTDDTVFLCFLAVLTFLLAYISLWLIVISRRPWLMLLANGIVMLINLGASSSNGYGYVVIFTIFSLLLLVRFTLAENMRHWRARGLRFSSDLTWDYMQIGTIFAVIVLLIAYLLPAGATGGQIYNAITMPNSPWSQLVDRIEVVFGGVSGGRGGSGAFFGDTVGLVGTVHLTSDPVLEYRLGPDTVDPTQYLITETYDHYDTKGSNTNGISSWVRSPGQYVDEKAGTVEPPASDHSTTNTYLISYDGAGAGLAGFLFAPGVTPRDFSVPASVLYDNQSSLPVTWHTTNPVAVSQIYQATGYVPTATIQQLEAVPYPAAVSGPGTQGGVYPPSILNSYLPPEEPIPSEITSLARKWTAGAKNMYDAATMIENHLRTNFKYSTDNPNPPAGQDATVWFLNRQQGFCTYFASAMALMGRSLGMPTRVVTGFSTGTYDAQAHAYVVRGTNAHAWPQVYFGSLGWVNFEPTAGFDQFSRAVAIGTPGTQATGTTVGANHTPVASATNQRGIREQTGNGTGASGQQDLLPLAFLLGGLAVLILLLAALFLAWWRALYRGQPRVTGAFARLVLLGRWAGVEVQPNQTPREYVEQLSRVIPSQRASLEEIADLYAQERWGGETPPVDDEHLTDLYAPSRGALATEIIERLRESPSDIASWLWDHRPGRRR